MTSTTATRSEIAEAQSLPIVDLVNYQDGSVVSRVVLTGCGKTPALVSLVCDAEGAVRE